MADFEISIPAQLAKGVFVLISAPCIATMRKDAMAEKGRRSMRPVLVWLAWCWQMRIRMSRVKS